MAKSSGTTTTTQQPVGVNRRTLLRTGAHAAWAIPAVQIVTQSPALAATGGQNPPPPAKLALGNASGSWTNNNPSRDRVVNTSIPIQNTGGQSAGVTEVRVWLTTPTGSAPAQSFTASTPAGVWTLAGGSGTEGAPWVFVTPTIGLGETSMGNPQFTRVNSTNQMPQAALQVHVTAVPATGTGFQNATFGVAAN